MLDDSKIGYEFEFFSNLTIEEIKYRLEKTIDKKIYYFNDAHSDFKPTDNIWKLERDLSGGKNMFELVTSPIYDKDAFLYCEKIFNFIKKYGYTTDKSAFQVNISFIDSNLIYKLNKLKLVLEFDEEYVYKEFNNRRNNLYTKSIKHIIPVYNYNSEYDLNPYNYKIPDSKYYGINFNKLKYNYLEFRYLGGKDYETKYNVIKDYILYFKKTFYNSCNNVFTQDNINNLKKIIKDKEIAWKSYKSYYDFQKNYPNIKLLVNLIKTDSYIELYYDKIKDNLVNILLNSNITTGIINYNSDYSSIELKDCKIDSCYEMHNIDFVNCDIKTGNITNCNLFESNISNAIIEDCGIYQTCTVESSKLINTTVNENSIINDCYVTGNRSIINGKILNSIIRFGNISSISRKEAINTEFIDNTTFKSKDNINTQAITNLLKNFYDNK